MQFTSWKSAVKTVAIIALGAVSFLAHGKIIYVAPPSPQQQCGDSWGYARQGTMERARQNRVAACQHLVTSQYPQAVTYRYVPMHSHYYRYATRHSHSK